MMRLGLADEIIGVVSMAMGGGSRKEGRRQKNRDQTPHTDDELAKEKNRS